MFDVSLLDAAMTTNMPVNFDYFCDFSNIFDESPAYARTPTSIHKHQPEKREFHSKQEHFKGLRGCSSNSPKYRAVGILVVRLLDSRPDDLCHQIPNEYTRSMCSLNQWVKMFCGWSPQKPRVHGDGEYFPLL
ncbi:hypothetical protein TNCV_147121 [Trichonephila clavipes]|nr:hypothetical protein TNCV_147121 [Trichonephila clavipes]